MRIDRGLIDFMRECLRFESVVATWGIIGIQLLESQLIFTVHGFNYIGQIRVLASGADLDLYSTKEYIGRVHCATQAVKLLDAYIEANEQEYQNLFKYLGR